MCSRYTAAKGFEDLIKILGFVLRVPFFAPRYNIAPTQMAPVIFLENTRPAMKLMRWGLIPSWAKDESTGTALINARVETVKTRQAFQQAYQKRRCIVPADSYYEWKEMYGERQPFRVMFKSGRPICFAGLWERWTRKPSTENFDTDLDGPPPSETIDSFTIITRPASAALSPLHDRMPVFLQADHCKRWLGDDDARSEVFTWALEHPAEDPLKIYPVSTLVNSPKTDDSRCVEPVRIDRDFFQTKWWGDE